MRRVPYQGIVTSEWRPSHPLHVVVWLRGTKSADVWEIDRMRMFRSVAALVVALLVGALTTLGAHAAPAAAGNAYVRVAHAAPAAPNVDVYVDGAKLLSGFTFGTVTDYVPLAAGSHDIAVTAAGQPASSAVIKQTVSVTAGVNYTVAAIGDTSTPPALVAFQDDNGVAAGMTKVRVYHLSSDAGPVSVAAGGQTVIPDLAFKNASDYLTVKPGDYTFNVTLKNSGKAAPLTATLTANQVVSVFALGLASGSGDTALKFVTKAVAGVPTGMPPTGFNPHPATTSHNTPVGAGLVAAVLALATLITLSVVAVRVSSKKAH